MQNAVASAGRWLNWRHSGRTAAGSRPIWCKHWRVARRSRMGTQAQVAQLQHGPQVPHGSLSSRVAFRFCVVYFGLYCLLTQIPGGLLPLPNLDIPDPSTLWPTRQIVTWTATHVFRVTHPLVYFSGSGDKTFDWVLAFCLLVVAAVATIVWSILDRQRLNYVTLHKWFRLFLRFALGGQMLAYGMAKVVPLQMPFPYLARLLEPFGNFSPMGVLWSSVGAAPTEDHRTPMGEKLPNGSSNLVRNGKGICRGTTFAMP